MPQPRPLQNRPNSSPSSVFPRLPLAARPIRAPKDRPNGRRDLLRVRREAVQEAEAEVGRRLQLVIAAFEDQLLTLGGGLHG